MIELKKAAPGDRELLWNINQKYLYEMTAFYPDEMDEKGNFHYGYFEEYFTDPRREALLISFDGRLAGFAMVNPYSYLGGHPDHVMAEFTVFPAFRRRHIALEAAQEILGGYGGTWEIKFHEKNLPAKSLWTKVTAPYHPEKISLNGAETVLTFSV